MKQIITVEEFYKELDNGTRDYFINFNGLRSSKTVLEFEDDTIELLNEIDGHAEIIHRKNIKNHIIYEAIQKGAFYKY